MLTLAKSEVTVGRLKIERLKLMLTKTRREQFGQSSERGRLLVEQLELAIEDLEETQAEQETRAEIENLVCEHSLMYSRGSLGFLDYTEEEKVMFKPVRQRLVRTHPVTGRKSLYLASHAASIIDWPVPEARLLLRDLTEHATQRQFVYAHKWSVGDLVMWDNRRTMHRARPFPVHEPRDMRRTTLIGDGPTV